ncbi:flagellar biosynthesis protein FlgA, partial [Mycobacterium sp. ITM-2017-0098]
GAHTRVDAVVGTTLAGPARRGEVLTDVRVLGPRLAESAAGPDARIVPIPLADAALMDVLRPGDIVDIVAAPVDEMTEAKLIATDA